MRETEQNLWLSSEADEGEEARTEKVRFLRGPKERNYMECLSLYICVHPAWLFGQLFY